MAIRARLEDWFDDVAAALGPRRQRRFARSPLAGVALALLCLAVYLPGLWTLPPVDRDEPRFAQASRQMFEAAALPEAQQTADLHSGGWVVPRFGDDPRLNKPPLIYWCQVASAWALTGGDPLQDALWMYRVPSVLAATLAVLLTWRIGLLLFDPRAACLGAGLLAVCPLVVGDAHLARADQVLLATTAATMLCLAAVWRSRGFERWPFWKRVTLPLLGWLFVGLGVLAKGPITPMIALLTMLALCLLRGRWRWLLRLRPLPDLLVLAAVVAPWAIAVGQRVGWDEYTSLVLSETVGRAGSPREGHSGPPGYHLVLLAILFWPGSMLTALAVARAARRARGVLSKAALKDDAQRRPLTQRARDAVRPWRGRRSEILCIAWIVPSWIIFELSATKLPHYTLPLYPAVALLTARGVFAAASGAIELAGSWPARYGLVIWVVIGFAITGAAPVALLLFSPSWIEAAIALMLSAAACVLLWRARSALRLGRVLPAHACAIASAVVAAWAIMGVGLPSANALWLSDRAIDAVRRTGIEPGDRPIAAAGFHEDSLVFLTRARIERIDRPIAWAIDNQRGFLLLPASETPGLDADPAAPPYERLTTIPGWNYSTGDPLRLDVLLLSPELPQP